MMGFDLPVLSSTANMSYFQATSISMEEVERKTGWGTYVKFSEEEREELGGNGEGRGEYYREVSSRHERDLRVLSNDA